MTKRQGKQMEADSRKGDISRLFQKALPRTSDEFTVRATSDPEEIQALLEVGFEYVCDKDGLMFFKKRK